MPETTQEEVEITALIKGILNGYPGNSAILREYLQNSDDAKALIQASFLSLLATTANELIVLIDLCLKLFILDERTHPSERIVDPSLKEAQGPALITYNDGILRPRDWKALRTIHSSSKQEDDG
jgi:sacsin